MKFNNVYKKFDISKEYVSGEFLHMRGSFTLYGNIVLGKFTFRYFSALLDTSKSSSVFSFQFDKSLT